jgi:hypothetical protein
MKKNIKIIAFIYIGVALLTYLLTLRVDNLEHQEDYENQSRELVFRVK